MFVLGREGFGDNWRRCQKIARVVKPRVGSKEVKSVIPFTFPDLQGEVFPRV